jgi:hypothetical protein
MGCMLGRGHVREGKDATESGFAASEIDTTTPHPARMYDALLGGKDHYRADQEAVRRLLVAAPEARDSAIVILSFRVSRGCDLGRPVVDGVVDGTLAA